MVVFGQKNGCNWTKVDFFGQSDSIREKLVLFLQSGCNRAKWLYSVKSGCIGSKVVVFVRKWLYSG